MRYFIGRSIYLVQCGENQMLYWLPRSPAGEYYVCYFEIVGYEPFKELGMNCLINDSAHFNIHNIMCMCKDSQHAIDDGKICHSMVAKSAEVLQIN